MCSTVFPVTKFPRGLWLTFQINGTGVILDNLGVTDLETTLVLLPVFQFSECSVCDPKLDGIHKKSLACCSKGTGRSLG